MLNDQLPKRAVNTCYSASTIIEKSSTRTHFKPAPGRHGQDGLGSFSPSKDFHVFMVTTIELNVQVNADPKFVSVLQIEFELALDNEQIDLDHEPLLQIAVEVADADPDNSNGNSDFVGLKVDITSNLLGVCVSHNLQQELEFEVMI